MHRIARIFLYIGFSASFFLWCRINRKACDWFKNGLKNVGGVEKMQQSCLEISSLFVTLQIEKIFAKFALMCAF